MLKEQIYEILNNNPTFFLATVDKGQPKVRGMLLYKADQNGIIFHTGTMKNVYQQIIQSPYAQLCFIDQQTGKQLRISGTLKLLEDRALKEEIVNHPSRSFLRTWKDNDEMEDFFETLAVFCLTNCKVKV